MRNRLLGLQFGTWDLRLVYEFIHAFQGPLVELGCLKRNEDSIRDDHRGPEFDVIPTTSSEDRVSGSGSQGLQRFFSREVHLWSGLSILVPSLKPDRYVHTYVNSLP